MIVRKVKGIKADIHQFFGTLSRGGEIWVVGGLKSIGYHTFNVYKINIVCPEKIFHVLIGKSEIIALRAHLPGLIILSCHFGRRPVDGLVYQVIPACGKGKTFLFRFFLALPGPLFFLVTIIGDFAILKKHQTEGAPVPSGLFTFGRHNIYDPVPVKLNIFYIYPKL